MARIGADTLYGTLNLLIMQALCEGSLHGLAISRRICQEAGEALNIDEGALYPALHRLERDGLVEGKWGISEARRRAKFYRLTEKGRRRLKGDAKRWVRHANAVAAVLRLGTVYSE